MIKASISLAGIKEKDIPKGEVLKRHGSVMASVGTGGVELGLNKVLPSLKALPVR